MLDKSLKGTFKWEFTEVLLTCVESDLPKDSSITVVDVRHNPKYSDIECVVLLNNNDLRDEVPKDIARGYHNVSMI